MRERRATLFRLLQFSLLLALNIIPCGEILPEQFPTQQVSSLYLFTLSVCLILSYFNRVAERGTLKRLSLLIAWMILLLIVLRGIKYSISPEVEKLRRLCWYLYYIPLLLIPLCMYFISIFVHTGEQHIPKKNRWAAAITIFLILLIVTNDLHQQAFRFREGFADWDSQYSYGWAFYAATIWEYGLYATAVGILVKKCRVSTARRQAWLIPLSFGMGLALVFLSVTGKMPELGGTHILEFPETFAFMVAAVLECCMQLGFIPTNENYEQFMRHCSAAVQITDTEGRVAYRSDAANALTEEQFHAPDGTRIAEHTILHRREVPGGVGFWQNDVRELDELNEVLSEIRDQLSEESELIRLQNELKEKQTQIEQRTLVYDAVARDTQTVSLTISRLSAEARASKDPELREERRKRIAFLGAYIKRYANLMLLSENSGTIPVGELSLSLGELLRYLKLCGVSGELRNTAEGNVSAEAVMSVLEACEQLLELNLPTLQGALALLSEQNGTVTLKLVLENCPLLCSESSRNRLRAAHVLATAELEDGNCYATFAMETGGAR